MSLISPPPQKKTSPPTKSKNLQEVVLVVVLVAVLVVVLVAVLVAV